MKRLLFALFLIPLPAYADNYAAMERMLLDHYAVTAPPTYRYPDSRESLDYAARELVIERAVSERMGGYAAPSSGSINWGDLAGRATNRALIENSIEYQRGLDRGR